MLEALRGEHALALLAWEPPDLDACNRFFGTSLRRADFELLLAPPMVRRLGALTPTPMALLKHGWPLRRAAAVAPRYDVVVTANNEADLGRRGIQYVHYPRLDPVRPAVDLRWYHASRGLLGFYRRVAAGLGPASAERMRANLTLVNSDFIGRRVRARHGIEPVTLHPPVPGDFPAVPWEAREDAVVCIGRLSPEKRVEDAVDVVRRVRAGGGDVRLHVVGSDGDRAYAREIRRLVREHAAWVSLRQDLSRADLVRLVARQRYGIHAMRDEHFGIAVAEMVRGGCIVFVPDTGGPVEIVGGEPRLLFASPEEAAERILATLRDPGRQAALRAHLAGRAELFSAERFVARFREIVRAF
jgi:glycosyltransferase involved in cell wall biosynthesis